MEVAMEVIITIVVAAVVEELSLAGFEELSLVCAAATLGKGRRPRAGSARMRVFGCAQKMPG